jgi:hypothetical protein
MVRIAQASGLAGRKAIDQLPKVIWKYKIRHDPQQIRAALMLN